MAAREAGADVDPDEAQRRAIAREDLPTSRSDGWIWLLEGFVVGAILWIVEFRYWDSFQPKRRLLRRPLLAAGGSIAGLITGMSAMLANDISDGRVWVTLLVLALAVSWPLLGFLDKRPPPGSASARSN